MNREPEDLQFLGIVGIYGEAFKILRSYAKSLGALALTVILPLSFSILVDMSVTEYQMGGAESEKIMRAWTLRESTEYYVFQAASTVFHFAFSLLSMAAVAYTVVSTYTGRNVSRARVMSIVLRLWKRHMVNYLCFFIIDIVFARAGMFAMPLLKSDVAVEKRNMGALIFYVILTTFVFWFVYRYIKMVSHLAFVITILEEKYGIDAIWKSKDLLKGKRKTAFALRIANEIFEGSILWVFRYIVIYGNRHGSGSAARGGYGVLLLGLLCFVHLMGLLIQSVFYFVCKSYHHENIDKSSLLDRLEVYLGDHVS